MAGPDPEAPSRRETAVPSSVLLYGLFAVSGALGLVYEVLWLRSLILIFGSTTFAVSTVLTAFMGGLAMGSWLFGRIADRLARPARAYALMEVGIGLYALTVPTLFALLVPVYRWLWVSYQPSFLAFSLLRFLLALVVLSLPTVLMGGTLPVLSRFLADRDEAVGRRVGGLYALNTGGAVLGTFAAGFLLLPHLGMRVTLWLAAAGNLAVGAVALAAYGRRRPRRPPVPRALPRPPRPAGETAALVAVALSGGVAMVYEVAWTRVVGLIIGGSVYAFTIMLTTFLVGLASGAAVAARVVDRLQGDGRRLLAALVAAAAVGSFLTLLAFGELPYLFAVVLRRVLGMPQLEIWLKFAIAFAVMFLPTFLLGGVFPAAIRACSRGAERVGGTVGRVYAANTLGTIFGSALAGFALLPALGVRATLLLAIGVHLVLAAGLLASASGGAARRWLPAAVCVLGAAAAPLAAPGWDALVMNSGMYLYAAELQDDTKGSFLDYLKGHGAELLYSRDGATASIIVVREPEIDNIFMATNGKADASTHFDMATQVLSAHLPLLLADDPREVLVVGYASGITVGSVLTHPVERVTAVEIEQAVIEASQFFRNHNGDPEADPRTKIVITDARNFLQVEDRSYDIIISEPSNPWITVAANLFTREAFELGRRRLRPGGIYAQWMQLYGITPAHLKALLRTFHDTFPEVMVFSTIPESDLILLGSDEPLRFRLSAMRERMRDLWVAADLARVGVRAPEDLLTYFELGTSGLAGFAGDGPRNTDDNALIEFATPRSLGRPTGRDNARALAEWRQPAEEFVTPSPADGEKKELQERLAAAYRRRGLPSPGPS